MQQLTGESVYYGVIRGRHTGQYRYLEVINDFPGVKLTTRNQLFNSFNTFTYFY